MQRKTTNVETVVDTGLQPLRRLALDPLRRSRKIPFFTVNTSLAWRYTWWSESLDPESATRVLNPVARSYCDMQARLDGPGLHADLEHAENNGVRGEVSSTRSSRG